MQQLNTIFAASLLLVATAATSLAQSEVVQIEQPWARASIGTTRPAAAYFTVANPSDQPIRVSGFEGTVADKIELHRTTVRDGMVSMKPAGPLVIPAGGSATLEPGGLHLMIMGLRKPLVEGESFSLTIQLERQEPMTITVPILGVGSQGPDEVR